MDLDQKGYLESGVIVQLEVLPSVPSKRFYIAQLGHMVAVSIDLILQLDFIQISTPFDMNIGPSI
jgi:hypothetical protein